MPREDREPHPERPLSQRAWDWLALPYIVLRNWGPFAWIRLLELRRTRGLLPEPSPGSVWIDVGCGDGGILRRAPWPGLRVGVDWSPRMARRVRRTGARPVVADARSLPFRDGCAGLVTALGLSEYLREHQALWRELSRVSAAGGVVVVTFSPPSPQNQLRRLLGRRLCLRRFARLAPEWERCGFRIVQRKGAFQQTIVRLEKKQT